MSKSLSLEHNIEPFIKDTKSLRKYLEKQLNDQIEFFNSGKQDHCIKYARIRVFTDPIRENMGQ